MGPITRIAVLSALFFSVGCASGQKAQDVTLPELEAGKSRIIFYRVAGPFRTNEQPEIVMDRRLLIGKSEPGYFSYVDVRPGMHAIECKAVETYLLGLYVAPGATAYVETSATLATVKNEPEARPKMRTLCFRPPITVLQPSATTQSTNSPQISQ